MKIQFGNLPDVNAEEDRNPVDENDVMVGGRPGLENDILNGIINSVLRLVDVLQQCFGPDRNKLA